MDHFVSNNWAKNRYQQLDDSRTQERTATRIALNISVVALCFVLVFLSYHTLNQRQPILRNVYVYMDAEQKASRGISPSFLSFGLDSSLLRDMRNLPITNERFINLARHLSPAFVRIGGTSADCLFFNKFVFNTSLATSPVDGQDITNFTLTDKNFAALYEFAVKSQVRMIFDLNVLIRNNDGSWDDSNARDVIQFAKSQNMDLDWQLGNEPNSFQHVFNVTITGKQLAQDYNKLRKTLNEFGYDGSLLVGPEANHIGDADHRGDLYVKEFLRNEENSINYVTWHQYYLNGREAKVEDFINPFTFTQLPMEIKSMQSAIDATGKKTPMWLSETSTAYGGGAPELSDRFVAGFLWLDKLGYSARVGVNVVIRQSFFGGNYAMVGPDITPNPDWWVSVMFKKFISEKVLEISVTGGQGYVRLYGHCTPEKALIDRVPALTIYGMNMRNIPIRLDISGFLQFITKHAKIFFYALSSDSLQSREIKLNGETLKLKGNDELPPFSPVIMDPQQTVILPPQSMIFMVMHGVNIPVCLSQET